MKPIDYRNATFAEMQSRITGMRAVVLAAWREHGPCTTEELALASGLSILSVRPRTTELYQMGYIIAEPCGRGIYRAATTAEAEAHFRHCASVARDPQLHLGI